MHNIRAAMPSIYETEASAEIKAKPLPIHLPLEIVYKIIKFSDEGTLKTICNVNSEWKGVVYRYANSSQIKIQKINNLLIDFLKPIDPLLIESLQKLTFLEITSDQAIKGINTKLWNDIIAIASRRSEVKTRPLTLNFDDMDQRTMRISSSVYGKISFWENIFSEITIAQFLNSKDPHKIEKYRKVAQQLVQSIWYDMLPKLVSSRIAKREEKLIAIQASCLTEEEKIEKSLHFAKAWLSGNDRSDTICEIGALLMERNEVFRAKKIVILDSLREGALDGVMIGLPSSLLYGSILLLTKFIYDYRDHRIKFSYENVILGTLISYIAVAIIGIVASIMARNERLNQLFEQRKVTRIS